jgi:23S rRNA G2069 N7-methylase RlmK/C1962 C5-methylase RlmI
MLANRLHKNARHLRRWARREQIACYRLYDCDIPEIPLVIDWYDGHLHVAEFASRGGWAQEDDDEGRGDDWLAAMVESCRSALALPEERVYVKRRRRQRGSWQYGIQDRAGAALWVPEGGHQFLVNLSDYLDTGLFLDHRLTRARVAGEARGTRFLNLFCYTGAFTVYAARAGARSTTSVDLSHTYLDWAGRNLAQNGIRGPQHRLVRADVREFLAGEQAAIARGEAAPYDLVVLDPPTFSNSKKMRWVLDLQRDHPELIRAAAAVTQPGGAIYFSTNARRFALARQELGGLAVEELGAATIPPDFRKRRPHQSFRLVPRPPGSGRRGGAP